MDLKRRLRLLQDPSLRVALAVVLLYVVFSLVALSLHGFDPLWFAWLGERYADLDPAGRRGYDGQFVYYIAALGSAAVPHLDAPAYRLQRILLPVLVRGISGLTALPIAWAIPLVNLVAIVVTTYLLARWLAARDITPWYACTYALYVGVLMAYSRNLTEPLAFCFGAWGVTLWQQERRAFAAAAFACAGLTKEIALIFPLGLCITTLLDRKFGQAVWAILATFPLLVWELYLGSAFGQLPVMSGPSLERLPLAGILPHLNADPGRLSAFLFAGLPAFAVIPVGLWLLWRHGPSQPAIWWALLHGVFVLLLPLNVYNHIMHAGRNAAGLVMSLVFLLPYLHRWLRLAGLVGALAPTLIWITPVLRWAPWLSEV